MKLLIAFCGIVLLSHSISGQQYTFRNYSVKDGLPQSQVMAMLEDKNGYLWIGTEGGGLARYDGREFKIYTTLDGLQSNKVVGLKIDRWQNLWILHPRGVTRFDGCSFVHFVAPNKNGVPLTLRRITLHNDSIFIATTGTLSKIYRDSVYYWDKPIMKGHTLNRLHETPGGNLLGITNEKYIWLKDSRGFSAVNLPDTTAIIFSMYNQDQTLVLGTTKGFYSVDEHSLDVKRIDFYTRRYVIDYDAERNLYWTTDGVHLYHENFVEGKSKIDTLLKNVSISCIIRDSEGATWIGTMAVGLYKYYAQDFERHEQTDQPAVMSIEIGKDGDLWLGSMMNGIYRINGKKERIYHNRFPGRNRINVIKADQNDNMWIGTSGGGLGKYIREKDSIQWYGRREGLLAPSIISIAHDNDGNVWLGTNGEGLLSFDGIRFSHHVLNSGARRVSVLALYYCDINDALYAGTDLGLFQARQQSIRKIPISTFENTSVTSINVFNDSLLVVGSAGAGLVLINSKGDIVRHISSRDGMPSDFIYFVVQDEEQRLWIGTEKGVTKLKLKDNYEIIETLQYDNDSGLTGVETNLNAYAFHGDKKYIGLIDGLYRYNQLPTTDSRSFDLHFTAIELRFEHEPVYHFADSVYSFFKIPYRPVLPSDKNHLTFHFNRVDKRYPKSVRYRYKLENFDKDWSLPTSANVATYNNLPPGSYIMRVMVTDKRGSWAQTQLAYPFTISSPFYKRPSFIVGVFLLLIGAGIFTAYWRIREQLKQSLMRQEIRMQEQESLRREIARDFHDEMGNQLTRIINYVSLLRLSTEADGPDRLETLYTKVENSAKHLYTGTRDFIWAIDPVNDELLMLFIHIRDFGEQLFEEKRINFRANSQVQERVQLPYGFTREANLIFKEAMTNAFKYSNACNVTLSLQFDNDYYILAVEDDGVGFDFRSVLKKNGLKNMRDRAERIHAELLVHSKSTAGTIVQLKFSVKNKHS